MPNNEPSSSIHRMSRRAFGRRAASAAALYFWPAAAISSSATAQAKANAKDSQEQAGNLPPDAVQEVEAKLANIVRKYGARLSEEQRKHLRRILTYDEKMLDSIRSFALSNGDPPASVLKFAYLEGGAFTASRNPAQKKSSARSTRRAKGALGNGE